MKTRCPLAFPPVLLALVVGLAPAGLAAQEVRMLHHDTSPTLTEMAAQLPPGLPTGLSIEVPNHTERNLSRPAVSVPDPLAQTDARPDPLLAPTPAPSVVFDGNTDAENSAVVGFAVVPPDTEGDVGPNHYMQWVNLIFSIYDKSGTRLMGPTAGSAFWVGFGGVCQTNNSGDPLVVYDHLADRWVVSQFTGFTGVQCVAVSTGPDPLGSYHRYSFQVAGPTSLPDYPKMGLWPDSYLYTANVFPGSFSNATACAFERTPMLSGATARVACANFPCTGSDCPFGVLPADLEGSAPAGGGGAPFFQYWDSAVDGNVCPDGVRAWELGTPWTTGSTTLTSLGCIPGAALDRELCGFSRSCIPQLGGENLDTLSSMTMWRAHYRHEATHDTVLLNTTADVGANRAGIRWAELRDDGSGWAFFQEGTYAPADGLNRWMGSVAMDEVGNLCIGYTASSSSVNPSIRYTCRSAGDPLGTLPGGEVILKAGTGSQVSSANRWGDYSSMNIDTNGCTFWHTNEYYQTTSSFNFRTSIGAFEFTDCTGGGGGGIPCADVRQMRGRCQVQGGSNRIGVNVVLTDTSHDTETIELSVDGVPTTVTISGRVGRFRQGGFTSGDHTVSLTDPAMCLADIVVTCP